MKRLLNELKKEYDALQQVYGDPNLHSIYFGGCVDRPDICLVFMNPTARNIAADMSWCGPHFPWIGTKNVWHLFFQIGVIGENLYTEIRTMRGKDWSPEFAKKVYQEVEKNRFYITNLAKCAQIDARGLPDSVYVQYLELFWEEMNVVKPKTIILFGNQVSSIVLGEKISVSQVRKKKFQRDGFTLFSVFYPVGNGAFHVDKALEDIHYIIEEQKFGVN